MTYARGSQRSASGTPTAERILDVAEPLVQLRGFNAVSYADIAAVLEITTASLHYHFRSKAELGSALVERYTRTFAMALAAIDETVADAPGKLAAYAGLYGSVLEGRRMCLCGVLAAEYETLPAEMQRAVVRFFDANEVWLGRVLVAGLDEGSLNFSGSPAGTARAVVSALEGALLVARSYHDLGRFEAAASRLIDALTVPSPTLPTAA